MSNKITWADVYEDFRARFPRLKEHVIDYRPYDYLTIKLWFKGCSAMLYNYLTKQCIFVRD